MNKIDNLLNEIVKKKVMIFKLLSTVGRTSVPVTVVLSVPVGLLLVASSGVGLWLFSVLICLTGTVHFGTGNSAQVAGRNVCFKFNSIPSNTTSQLQKLDYDSMT